MERTRRPSAQTETILMALARHPTKWRYGYDLCQQTGIKPGSMYPILMRLADRGMLHTNWETQTSEGRPPRHLYRLSAAGLRVAGELAAPRKRAAGGRLS